MLEAAYKDTLYIISDEMKVTLGDIKSALELAIDTKDNRPLSKVRDLLQTAKGALDVINFNATALLADEMILTVNTLLDHSAKNRDLSLDAISSGVVLLPSFFTKTVDSEGRENSIALLPILQELRAARQAKPLSQDTMYLLDIKGEGLSDKPVQIPQLSNTEDLRLQIGKYRQVFQGSLLGWIKGADHETHLARLALITEKFEQAAKQERAFKLWWVTGGIIEALSEKGLKSSPELRRLFGQVDRAGKIILDKGEDYFQEQTDPGLINQLLYFIGRSTTSGKRVAEIRKAFSLHESLPLEDKFVAAKAAMAAPDTEVMSSLSIAIREDLDKVKDALDIYNRTGSKDNLQIEKRFDSLRKIADTLQMLGLSELEKRVLQQQKEITDLLDRNEPLTDNHLIAVAASLLQVESRLEEELDKLAGKKEKSKPKYLLEALEATYRESKVNLARVKEVISQFMRDPTDLNPISRAPVLLKEAQAATMIADKDRLALVLGRLQDYITRQLIGSGRLPYAEHLELLAGAIESVDFYLETLHKGRRDPWYMLDNADNCLEQLLRDAPAPLVKQTNLPESVEPGSTIALKQAGADDIEATDVMPALAIDAITGAGKQSETNFSAHPDAYPIMDQSLETDPEVIEIFIEEANEVQIEIKREFQSWRSDDSQREALISVRRGFHTLKGSGRMVGAKRLGELAWQAENLINRVLEGTVQLDDDGLHLLDRTVDVIPSLIEQLESGAETNVDAHQLMLSIESFVEQKLKVQIDESELSYLPGAMSGFADEPELNEQESDTQPIDVSVLSEIDDSEFDQLEESPHTQIIDMRKLLPTEEKKSAAQESEAHTLDSPLYEIFTEESAKHLQVISEFCRDSSGAAVTDKMHRAVHTLHGSTNMAGLTQIMNLSGELEHFIQRLYDEGAPLEGEAAKVVAETAENVQAMIATINQDRDMPIASPDLIEKLRSLRSGIDFDIEGESKEPSAFDADDLELDFSLLDDVIKEDIETLALDAEEPEISEAQTDLSSSDTTELLDELEVELDDVLVVTDNTTAHEDTPEVEQTPTMLAVDSEITEIFVEEAEEIIALTDAVVATWDKSGLSDDANMELQRHLHTLKGGARMAGLLTIGDFTHELESFMIALKDNSIEQNDQSKKILQSAIDHMHSMLSDVQQGSPPSAAPKVLKAIHDLLPGTQTTETQEPVIQEVPEVVVEKETPEFSDEALSDLSMKPQPSLKAEHEQQVPVALVKEQISEPVLESGDNALEIQKEEPVDTSTSPQTEIKEKVSEIVEPVSTQTIPVSPSSDVDEESDVDVDSIFAYTSEVAATQQRQQDAARISTSNLETLLNQAGEISIFRSRIEQELSNANLNLAELARTVLRVKEQLRKMEIETEATILYQHRDETEHQDFDPLEMDRYSNVQQVSRALAESVNDLSSLESSLENQFRDTEALLLQQSRVMTDLQDNLMRVRMIPFARYAPRYARIVRQIATETSKEVDLKVIGADSEIDRQVIERMQAPLEHMIRNAVIHGIESPEQRKTVGKDPEGIIELHLSREGAQLLLELKDDGAGLNFDRIREKALGLGLLAANQKASDADLAQLILNTGFSTAASVTQSAGRGVGMDVVASEIKQLGGSLQISSKQGKGTHFMMRLPFTRAINHALMVRVGEENYAIPIHKIDGVAKMSLREVQSLLASDNPVYQYAGREYEVKNLAQLVGSHNIGFEPDEHVLSLVMVTGGHHHAALIVNELLGSREMVIKPVGPQIAAIRGISGATILGDGRIVIILDMDAILGVQLHEISVTQVPVEQQTQPLILVVDDSITVRRVTERLLERNKIQVLTARDGMDALSVLQDHVPDLILMDIEMPRMDGYELAEHVRKDERTQKIPIIMITSRTGDKHRKRAMEIGVDDYLGKPYREDQLLEAIKPHIAN